jgi:hypothetical protein
MRMSFLWSLFIASALVACGDLITPGPDPNAGRDGDDGTDRSGDDDAGSADARSDASTLRVVSFTVTPARLVPGGSVVLSVIVSDALGAGNIARAEVVDDTGASYAPLTLSGSFTATATITWDDVQRARRISFGPGGETRFLAARITNRQGYVSTQYADLSLHCADDTQGACNGKCVSFAASPNCGVCGRTCATGAVCTRGACSR